MEILRKAGGNVVNGSFFSWRNIYYSLQIECNEITYEKKLSSGSTLGGIPFSYSPVFKKRFWFKKKDVTFWKSFLFHKMAWILFSQLSLKWMHLTAFSRSFLVGWKKCSSRTICVDFFAKVDLLSFSGWVFSKMDKEKNSSTIDLFFSIEIKSEPGFRSLRREKSVKGWVYVFLLFDLV